jgi:hypothetical protein
MRICFIDAETTELNRRTRRIWDFACIVRDDAGPATDQEFQFFIEVGQRKANPFSLNVGGFWERYPQTYEARRKLREQDKMFSGWDAAKRIQELTAGATWVGAVPSFDEESCADLLYKNDLLPRWDYHLVDVETYAAGVIHLPPPWKNDVVNAAFGITIPEADRHTALGDARGVRDLWDAANGER